MDNTVGFTIAEVMSKVIRGFLGAKLMTTLLPAIGVAALTYGLLDAIMVPPKKRKFNPFTTKTDQETIAALWVSLIGSVAIVTNVMIFASFFKSEGDMLNRILGLVFVTLAGFVGCWIASWNLKRYLKPKDTDSDKLRKRKELLLEQTTLYSYATKYVIGRSSDWLAQLLSGALSIIGRTLHGSLHYLFVANYVQIAFAINAILSIVLVVIMGNTQGAGSANIIGSMLGGGIHYMLRANKAKEIHHEYQMRRRRCTR